MKNFLITTIFTVMIFSVVTIIACKKDACNNYVCYNSGTCVNGKCVCPTGYSGVTCSLLDSTAIVYHNNSTTSIYIQLDDPGNHFDSIPPGGQLIAKGPFGTAVSVDAITYGINGFAPGPGEPIDWTRTDYFPNKGAMDIFFDVPSQYFFLRVVNNSTSSIQTIHVDSTTAYPMSSNVNLAPGGTYPVGYFMAFTNSTVSLVSSSGQVWKFDALAIPFTTNQIITVTAN